MQDFASAAMVRLLVRAMAAHGLTPPPPGPHANGLAASHVPLAYKRSVVAAVLHQGGLGTLLHLARRVDLLAGDPLHRALLGAASIPELLARWQRLERYVHSRHQVSVVASAPGALVLRHHAVRGASGAPLPAESLAVLGVLLGAGCAMGVGPLQVDIGPPDVGGPQVSLCLSAGSAAPPPAPEALPEALLEHLAEQGQLGQWTLRWAATERAEAPACTPLAGALLATGHLCDTLPWPPLARALARHVLRDPAALHGVATLAQHAGLAPRSLQRALARHGLSCRDILAEARARMAAQWLLDSRHGLAEIGFACGFADQPHFTREFSRRVGLTPARYRDAFSGRCRVAHGESEGQSSAHRPLADTAEAQTPSRT